MPRWKGREVRKATQVRTRRSELQRVVQGHLTTQSGHDDQMRKPKVSKNGSRPSLPLRWSNMER
eukprot:1147214-Pelagomonas_calceolata.AAC.4